MALATSHPHGVYSSGGTDHLRLVHTVPGWASALAIAAILGLLVAGVWFMARAARRMSRAGQIVAGLVAVYTFVGTVVAFLDAYRPTGDWRGALVEGAFLVLYGLVAAGIVWAVDKGAKRFRARAPV